MNHSPEIPFSHSKKLFWLLLSAWFVLNLLQAYFTELLHDEAYYYFYSTRMAWGFYDHPPMIALLIKMGYLLVPNELGVRLWVSVLSVFSIVMIADMVKVRNYLLFFAFLFSVFIFQIFGFIAIPDSPLIFFTVLFFYCYKRYLDANRWQDVLLLSIAVAGLMYSKYLGVLVILFTFLSNLKLVKRKTFWIALILSALLMLPHLFWQINNDFVSVYFHLVERNRDTVFDVMNIANYLLGQVGILNPLVAFIILYYAFKNKAKNDFEKALKLNVAGILAVGLLLTLNGPVEANWTAVAYIPLLILAYPPLQDNLKIHKTFIVLATISFLLVMTLRIYLVYDFLPGNREHALQGEFHGWNKWAGEVEELAGDKPVVFINSYQKASKYLFYSNQQAFTFNNLLYRKNQYDLHMTEAGLAGKKVLFMHGEKGIRVTGLDAYQIPRPDSMVIMGHKWYYKEIEEYHSYNFVPVEIELESNRFGAGSLTGIPVEVINPLDTAFTITQEQGGTYLAVSFSRNGRVVQYAESEDISLLWLDKSYKTVLLTRAPKEAGNYDLRVSIRSGWFPPGLNSRITKVRITE